MAGEVLSCEFISVKCGGDSQAVVTTLPSGTGRLLSGRMNLHCQGLRTGQGGQLKAAVRDLHELAERTSQWTLRSDIVPLCDNAALCLYVRCMSRLPNDGRWNYTGGRIE
jgi:hypothetical protein